MAKPDTWMPVFIGDYLADTMHLNAEQHGAYLMLLFAAWMRGGSLPADNDQLARLARCTEKQWQKVKPTVAPFFSEKDGMWTQKRISAELERAKGNANKAEDKARKAAEARWGKNAPSNASSTAPSIPPSNASSTPQALHEECPPPPPSTPSEAKASEGKARAKRPTLVPASFAVSERVRQWAASKGFGLLDEHLDVFKRKAAAKGYEYIDHDSAFMEAIREDWAGLRGKNAPPASHPASAQRWNEI
jgi:uncharacterized protein YdaU (DUF1376 family)